MKRMYGLIIVLLAWHVSGNAADVYMCDTPAGKEYRSSSNSKKCRKVDLPGLTIVKPDARLGNSTTAVAPSRIVVDGQVSQQSADRQAKEQKLRAEEQRLVALREAYNNGEPERLGNERNYAKYQERVSAMQQELDEAERSVDALRSELRQ